ncbi:MAG: deoxyribodipyrimidine photo-lyase, partial [Bdellovibrio sp.]|nr:deoxyribodipyrimidine photo-lyase [Bdellovibrio sp.]
MAKVIIFWFRRDLRLNDNAGLFQALKENENVLPLFIFDSDILDKLEDSRDPRVTFIYQTVAGIKNTLQRKKSDLVVRYGNPLEVFKALFEEKKFAAIYTNHDYEPSARERDEKVAKWAQKSGVEFKSFKDQTLFEKEEILTEARKPYTVYTPYKKKVLSSLEPFYLKSYPNDLYESSFAKIAKPEKMMPLSEIGFAESTLEFPSMEVS